jgi:hypothetical protein
MRQAALLAAVERSPEAAAARDRGGWVGRFTDDGRIEDPVGARAHVGHVEIGRFTTPSSGRATSSFIGVSISSRLPALRPPRK